MRCPLFVELCAGTAALSLRLHHPRARPPVSRMGAKTGYADVILRCMGLRPGQGSADGTRYLWCEPDAGVRLLLHAYTDRELATAAADIIRGWADEEPRALWERLRAEGPARCPPVDPREVARWALVGQWSFRRGQPESGFNAGLLKDREPTPTGGNGCKARTCEQEASLWNHVPTVTATITDDARKVRPTAMPAGVVVYIDPPYRGTTGYAHAFPRSEWLPVVRQWAAAGALVVVSEAEPIDDLLDDRWHAVEITGERVGQKRTFSKQQREWLTMSRPPSWRPSVQISLFNAGG